jgi:hypothetical protein
LRRSLRGKPQELKKRLLKMNQPGLRRIKKTIGNPDVFSRSKLITVEIKLSTQLGRFAENLAGSSDAGEPLAGSRIRRRRPVHQPNV